MTSAADPAPVALAAAQVFEAQRVPYLIGGSLASTLHGEPRGTLDVDFAIDLAADDAYALSEALAVEFHVAPEDVLDAATRKGLFNAIHRVAFVKVDAHVREPVGHFAEELRRALEVELAPGRTARFATPEDTLLRKLWWYRRGDEVSDRQWRDALGILRTSGPRLDLPYIRRWAVELDVADLVERVRREL